MLPAALEAMDAFIKEHPIDADRVYVTGQSMGGFGSLATISYRPDAFAAAIPVCGGGDSENANKIKQIAIWLTYASVTNKIHKVFFR